MDVFQEGHRFQFGKNVPAVVEKAVDSSLGLYLCVYLQNNMKVVRDQFTFDGEEWHLPDEPSGRVLRYAEEVRFLGLLKR